MAWVKIDDQLYTHEKRWEIGLDGIGLFVVMLCYANDKLTDGFVPKAFVQAQVSRPDRRGSLKSLIAAEMVVETESADYQIVGYLNFQPSRAEVLARRAERSAAGRKGAAAKHAKSGNSSGNSHSSSSGSSCGYPLGTTVAPYPGRKG